MTNTTNEASLLAAVKGLCPFISGLRNEDISETFRDKIEKVLAVVEAEENKYSYLPPECTYVDDDGDGYSPVEGNGEVRYDRWACEDQEYLHPGEGHWSQDEMDQHCTYIGDRT